jgi:D-glycero-D-manno-heptose 1,7-bisphosphate phosphatase
MQINSPSADDDPVTIRQCAILVGGLGSRLGDITATTPKPILDCGGRPFLFWLMREFVRFGVRDFLLLTGHLSEALEAALPGIRARLPMNVNITISREPVRAGTGGAIFWARSLLEERFFLCNGDSVFDCNLAALLAQEAAEPRAAYLALRKVPDASRYGRVELSGRRVVSFAARPTGSTVSGTINAGIYIIRRDALMPHLYETCSLEADVLPVLASIGELGGRLCDGFFIDIGVPEDLFRAQSELPDRLQRRALFLDRDGVLNHDLGWVGHRDRFTWIDGAIAAIAQATQAGWHVFVVTNQSGVARGLYTEPDVARLLASITDEIRAAGGTIDDFRYCPFHPEAELPAYRRDSDWRKPKPGMLLDLIRRWEVEPARCHMIGDQASDMLAAAGAGVPATLFSGGNLQDVVARVLTTLPDKMEV